ncbi:MAG: pseudouridine synthase [Candidatus Woesearchaeota archaeon]|jgi:23S rRNA pseudouridine2605 synthase|nr:pseudouridine synthase [Candidatus Woesearchaeota archaeon]MDP7506444.1 pseudouridine synthase [Candidatus Woesearchaeota archaeon]MDP7610386.1 pseudouridine synthase [Candidatus Woesearchaeota archaeon]|tara:strand:- start:4407 stop:5090 length:684 start_codon:yes stop_codon:yes gene_type:complete
MDRVQKLLSNYGYISRRKAEEIIKEGRVKVNGKVISIGDKASEEDKISVDGKLVKKQEKVYIMFHKPLGCVTALTDPQYKTVMDFINVKERVFPIGRLDYNSSGLLLLTNDGDFANKVMHPRYEVNKTYMAEINNPISYNKIKLIERGMRLEGEKTAPAQVKKHGLRLIEITIHEGKNRIIRKILEELEFKVISLKRIKIGNLELGNLKPEEYRNLTEKDKERVFES